MGQCCSRSRSAKNENGIKILSAPPPYETLKDAVVNPARTYKNPGPPPPLPIHPALRDEGVERQIHRPMQDSRQWTTIPSIYSKEQANDELSLLSNPRSPIAERITATSTPLWRWSNAQCRTWLAEVLIVYGGKSPNEALDLAQQFKGWGPNLYLKDWKQWNSWLGLEGQAIFALLMEVHTQEGAVPKNVEIPHYALENGSGSPRDIRAESTEKSTDITKTELNTDAERAERKAATRQWI